MTHDLWKPLALAVALATIIAVLFGVTRAKPQSHILPGHVTPGSVPSIPAARPSYPAPVPRFHGSRGAPAVVMPYVYGYSNHHGASVTIIDNFKPKEYDISAVYPFGRKIESKWVSVTNFETPEETAERDAEWHEAGRTFLCFKCKR